MLEKGDVKLNTEYDANDLDLISDTAGNDRKRRRYDKTWYY